MLWDVFISHASEDKDRVARPLARLLEARGLRVWLDEQQLRIGDKLSAKVNEALTFSRKGVVVLSEAFLGKDYPKKELQALLSRETAEGGYILPVLHRISHDQIKQEIPLLADNLAASTDGGLEAVADQIERAASIDPTGTARPAPVRYFKSFAFPARTVERAQDSIQVLRKSSTWPHLAPERDMTDRNLWMGTSSPILISLLYDLYSPLALFHALSYSLKRSLSTLERLDRLRFGYLEAALYAYFNEAELAACGTPLDYTPRVSDWREKRAVEPSRYWWQGLSRERLDSALPYFVEPGEDELSKVLRDFPSFRLGYEQAYRGPGRAQQALGLVGNPLFGFTPRERPVYWRLLALWEVCYKEFLGSKADSRVDQVEVILSRSWNGNLGESRDQPEAVERTRSAVSQFMDLFVLPRLRIYADQLPTEENA